MYATVFDSCTLPNLNNLAVDIPAHLYDNYVTTDSDTLISFLRRSRCVLKGLSLVMGYSTNGPASAAHFAECLRQIPSLVNLSITCNILVWPYIFSCLIRSTSDTPSSISSSRHDNAGDIAPNLQSLDIMENEYGTKRPSARACKKLGQMLRSRTGAADPYATRLSRVTATVPMSLGFGSRSNDQQSVLKLLGYKAVRALRKSRKDGMYVALNYRGTDVLHPGLSADGSWSFETI